MPSARPSRTSSKTPAPFWSLRAPCPSPACMPGARSTEFADHAGGRHLRRQHELRPAALRRGTRRTGRTTRSHPRRHHPRASRQLQRFCTLLGDRNITEFNYRFAIPTTAHIFVGVEVADRRRGPSCRRRSTGRRSRPLDLTDNEMAKLHVRHLVGGRAHGRARAPVPLRVPRAPRRADEFPQRLTRTGTSACSTTETTARTSAACWWECRCPREMRRIPRSSTGLATATWMRATIQRTGCSWAAEFAGRTAPHDGKPCRAAAGQCLRNLPECCILSEFGLAGRFRQGLCSSQFACSVADLNTTSADAGWRTPRRLPHGAGCGNWRTRTRCRA